MSAPRSVPAVTDPAAKSAGAGAVGGTERESVEEFLTAVRGLVDRVGGRLVDTAARRDDDEALLWRGTVVAAVRLSDHPAAQRVEVPAETGGGAAESDPDGGGLSGILAGVERQFDGPLSGLSRPDKQRAVRLLEESGAFSYRKAVETVASALGVSRFTVYNYLNRERA